MAYEPTPQDTNLPTFEKQPPDVYAECRKVISENAYGRGRWPAMMERHLERASHWWVDTMQEPYNDQCERPRLVALGGHQQGERWLSPYTDRVVHALRVFFTLPPAFQRIIVAAREDGIWWRGEPDKHFTRVIFECDLSAEMGADNYRIEAVRFMKALKAVHELPYDKTKRLAG